MINKIVLILWLMIVVLMGCSNDNDEAETVTIDQIHQREGVPVRVREVNQHPFDIRYSYNASLTGIKETPLTALVGDRIENVYVSVGDQVQKDELLISLPEDNPQGQYAQAKAAYENALSTYNRMKPLYEAGGISRQDIEQLETQLAVNRANYQASRQMIKIKAPFTGYITEIAVRESEKIGVGEALATVSDLSRFKAKIWATEEEIDDMKQGNEAYATWRGHVFKGEVVQVAQSMDPFRQGFIVDVEFDNPQEMKLTGVQVKIDIIAYEVPEAIIVPRQYIHAIGNGKGHVFVAENSQALRRDVVLGRTDGLRYEILEGLSPGEQLITEGTNAVNDEVTIRIIGNND